MEKNNKKRKYISKIILFCGILVLLVPLCLNIYNKYNNKVTIESFREQQKIEQKSKTKETKNHYDYIENNKEDNILGILNIPSINEEIPIYKDQEGKLDYLLDKGVVLISRASLVDNKILKENIKKEEETKLNLDPHKNKNIVLTGHRGTLKTNLNIFKNLDKLKKDDLIFIDNGDKLLVYKVYKKFVINPEDGNLIYKDEKNENFNKLTLVTCTPFLVNSHRLIIKAGLVKQTDTTDTKLLNNVPNNTVSENIKLLNPINVAITSVILAFIIKIIVSKIHKRRQDED